MRAPFVLAAVLAGASLAFAACAHGDSIGSPAGGAGTTGPDGGETTSSTSGTTGSTGSGQQCGGLVGPEVTACCTACMKDGMPCQKNGCFNGYWCKPATCGCALPPTNCP
jgi:hypothetical protein